MDPSVTACLFLVRALQSLVRGPHRSTLTLMNLSISHCAAAPSAPYRLSHCARMLSWASAQLRALAGRFFLRRDRGGDGEGTAGGPGRGTAQKKEGSRAAAEGDLRSLRRLPKAL
eukprot:scaffold1724_cov246-Pinguiococcus_pyrenoidosus.AAC.5